MLSRSYCLLGLFFLVCHLGCCNVHVVRNGGCGAAPCGTCADDFCDGPGFFHNLASKLHGAHCSSGCGERYWDEQINEPRVCDPCGCDGGFVGGEDCGRCPGALHRLRELWGHRFIPSNCGQCFDSCDSGCSSCGSGAATYVNHARAIQEPSSMTQPVPTESTEIRSVPSSSAIGQGVPTPAKQPSPAPKTQDSVTPTEPASKGTTLQRPSSQLRAKAVSSRSRQTTR
jgi:hypothetical protein